MSYRYSQIPTLNNIQFVPETFTLPEKYHKYPIDKEWYLENVRDWQMPRPYLQPIQQTDLQYIDAYVNYLATVVGSDIFLYIVDCDGVEVVAPFAPDFVILNANATYTDPDGTILRMIPNKWAFQFSEFGLSSGIYRVVARVRFYDNEASLSETRLWISEPILLKDDHPDTIFIEAWNNTNKGDVIFQYNQLDPADYIGTSFFTPKFGIRVYGDIDMNPKTSRVAVNFEEQDYQTRQLSAGGQTSGFLYIGGDYGVPFYVRDKVNEYLKCDNIYAEGRQKVVVDEADWEQLEAPFYPLYGAMIEVKDYDRRDKFTDTKGTVIDLFTIPAYPFVVFHVALSGVSTIIYGWKVYNDSDRDDLLDHLNDNIKYWNGQDGDYLIADGKFKYANGNNENVSVTISVLLTEYFRFEVTTAAINQTFKINYDNVVGHIDWDDGSNHNILATGNTPGAANTISGWTYAAAGTYNPYFFHDDETTKGIAILNDTFTGKITGQITGNLPLTLEGFGIRNAPDLGTAHAFALGFLGRCAATLKSLAILNCGLTSISDTVFFANKYVFPSNEDWEVLAAVSLGGNALSVAQVNAFIIDFYENTPKFVQGVFAITQTPPAAPTGTALTYANNLSTIFGWLVIKN